MSDNSTPDNDPIDKAYVQAESLLSDDEARAARRARVLAAVAREPATPPAPPPTSVSPPDRRPGTWRRGGWLAAACVAGLSVFAAVQIYRPAPRQARTAPPASTQTLPMTAATPAPSTPPPPKAPETVVAPPQVPAPAPSPRLDVPMIAPPPPPPLVEPARRSFPAAPVAAPSPPPPAPPPIVAEEQAASPRSAKASEDFSGQAAADAAGVSRPASPAAALQPDQGARLRAAAARGRTAEVEALLEQGTPVDAPDAYGDTALMKSIQADHPAVAAILRRHGASLDRRNRAGESARDMAAAKDDPELDQALGLVP